MSLFTRINMGMSTLTKYHANLNIPVEFEDFEPPSQLFLEKNLPIKNISNEFKDWLSSLGIILTRCVFFCSPPHRTYRPHTDGSFFDHEDWAKINIIFNSTDTTMSWYNAHEDSKEGYLETNTQGKIIRYWDPKHCDVLYQTPVNQNCLINGTVIHDLKNGPNNGNMRSCYSMWIADKETKQLLSWNDAATRLAPFIF
jgi:hypothetical protein